MTAEGLHVVFGTGPAGLWTARALSEMGLRVRAVNRSGARPPLMPESVEIVTVADATVPEDATRAAQGAAVIYQALNPPYAKWAELFPPLQAGVVAAAQANGARYVSLENLYLYGHVDGPITEDLPLAPVSAKGRVRASMAEELERLQAAGELEVATARAADYYGPTVTNSAMGDRTFAAIVAGKPGEAMARSDVPHSYAYIEDVGRAAATLGTNDGAFGRVWFVPHARAVTQGEMIRKAAAAAGMEPKVRVMGPFMLRLGGLFIPEAREMIEMLYEFDSPFVVDSSRIEAAFGLAPTPVEDGLRETVAWYQARATRGGASA